MTEDICFIGYSGHAYVIIDIALLCGYKTQYYIEKNEKSNNPYNLKYLGSDSMLLSNLNAINNSLFIISIGNNHIRKYISNKIGTQDINYAVLSHPRATVASSVIIGAGSVIMCNAVINPLAKIGRHVICNTGCIIEHECSIGDYAHVAPGAVLTGNVEVGEGAFVGANAVIKPGIKVGKDAVIGAGAVVLTDIPEKGVVYGNPATSKL